MKQTVAIIGAYGKMGRGLSHNLAKAGYRILLIGHSTEKLEKLQQEILLGSPGADTEILNCARNGSWEADIIIPAIPYCHQSEMIERIREVVTGKIVVNIANPFNPSYDGLLTMGGLSAAEEMQLLLPRAFVVKAFNTIYAADFYTDRINRQIPDCFIAGDDDDAVAIVARMVRDCGFNPVIAGKLVASRTLENMMLLLAGITKRYNYDGFAGWKVLNEA